MLDLLITNVAQAATLLAQLPQHRFSRSTGIHSQRQFLRSPTSKVVVEAACTLLRIGNPDDAACR